MEMRNNMQLRPDLVAHLQAMVRQAITPSQILAWLKPLVDEKGQFTAYMQAACLDDSCDEGTIWLVAARWWTGNQTAYGADRLLVPIFDACRDRWHGRQQQSDAPRAGQE
jgi:hypothetical protein